MGASNSAVKQSEEDWSGTLHNDTVSGNSPLRQGARTNTTRDTLQAPRATCHVSRCPGVQVEARVRCRGTVTINSLLIDRLPLDN